MTEKDYRLVVVGNTQIGLIGLKEIFKELKSQRGKTRICSKGDAGGAGGAEKLYS
jgi:hypothetical protein